MSEAFSINDLRRILLEGAGVSESGALDGDILDTEFEDLGYDSLALLETSGRIDRELGIRLPDSAVIESRTPRALLQTVNNLLVGVAG